MRSSTHTAPPSMTRLPSARMRSERSSRAGACSVTISPSSRVDSSLSRYRSLAMLSAAKVPRTFSISAMSRWTMVLMSSDSWLASAAANCMASSAAVSRGSSGSAAESRTSAATSSVISWRRRLASAAACASPARPLRAAAACAETLRSRLMPCGNSASPVRTCCRWLTSRLMFCTSRMASTIDTATNTAAIRISLELRRSRSMKRAEGAVATCSSSSGVMDVARSGVGPLRGADMRRAPCCKRCADGGDDQPAA